MWSAWSPTTIAQVVFKWPQTNSWNQISNPKSLTGSLRDRLLVHYYVKKIGSSLRFREIVKYADDTTLCLLKIQQKVCSLKTHEEGEVSSYLWISIFKAITHGLKVMFSVQGWRSSAQTRVPSRRSSPIAHSSYEAAHEERDVSAERCRSVSHGEDVSEYIIGCVLNANHAPLAHVLFPRTYNNFYCRCRTCERQVQDGTSSATMPLICL